MAKKPKKRTVHWTKLPRPKLVSMVKRLEMANAKLKTQLAEMRETWLLNDGVALRSAFHPDSIETVEIEIKDSAEQTGFKIMPNPFEDAEQQACELFGVVHITQDAGGTELRPLPRVRGFPRLFEGQDATTPLPHNKMPWE